MNDAGERIKEEKRLVVEMIDASWELAEKRGPHSLEKGCNCIACINKRKRLIYDAARFYEYEL